MRNYCAKIHEKTKTQKGKLGTQKKKNYFYLRAFADLIPK